MGSLISSYLWTLFFLLMLYSANSEPFKEGGADSSSCVSLVPKSSTAQTSASPFSIKVSVTTYTPGETLNLTITGKDYMGLILQGRATNMTNKAVGTFVSPPTNTKVMQCSNPADTITHSALKKQTPSTTYMWKAPDKDVGPVQFAATVATDKDTFWKDIKSSLLTAEVPVMTTEMMTTDGNTTSVPDGNSTEAAMTPAGQVTLDETTAKAQNVQNMTTASPNSGSSKNGAETIRFFDALLVIGTMSLISIFFV